MPNSALNKPEIRKETGKYVGFYFLRLGVIVKECFNIVTVSKTQR